MQAIDYRAKAHELRTLAELLHREAARARILRVASYYDRLAELIEKYEPDPWIPGSPQDHRKGMDPSR